MSVVSYKCPSCAGTLQFDSGEQKLKCDSCKNVYELDDVKAFNEALEAEQGSDYSWDTYSEESGTGAFSDQECENMTVYTCPSCGAEIMADATTAATECLYCGNNTILPDKLKGAFRPDLVIPFKINKDQAKEKLKDFYKGKPLLPKFFKSENRVKEITGIYVPFWLYDCDADANIAFNATKTRHWSDSSYNYTETSHYYVSRAGQIGFDNVPADGSSKADDDTMESIEPFDIKDAKPYDAAFLSGYLADKYDVTEKDNQPRINKRIENSTVDSFRNTVVGYTSVTVKNANIRLGNNKIKYVLMPVWMLNTKYQDKMYTFALNAQTGKVAGQLPISKGRYWGWLFGIAGTIAVIASIINLI